MWKRKIHLPESRYPGPPPVDAGEMLDVGAVGMILDIGGFSASSNSRLVRGDCLLFTKTGADYSPCFGAEGVERVIVAKSVLLYCMLPKLYCV